MTIYIAILRGINVGRAKSIKMDALKYSFEKSGFQKVTTYVQSGNVVFSGGGQQTSELEQKIASQVLTDFDVEIPVIVLTTEMLKQIIDGNPFAKDAGKDRSFLHVTFLASNPGEFDKESITAKKQGGEEIVFSEKAVYLYCPNGYGRTNLNNNFLEKKMKVSATTRNWKTTNELLNIAQSLYNKLK